MGVVAGLGLGVLLVALVEYFDRTMRTEEDIRIALNLPVLATLPLIRSRVESPRRRFLMLVFSGLAILMSVATAGRLLE
jgi:ABC-type nitrate/sulfonate/bicarbonate transport system permease component